MSRPALLPLLGALLLAAAAGSAQTRLGAPLPLPPLAQGDQLGTALATCGDLIAVGAYLSDEAGADAGAVYLYRRTASGGWERREPPLRGDSAGDHFGFDVAFDENGTRLIVGAPRARNRAGARSGAAYLFDVDPADGRASGRQPVSIPGGREGDEIGSAVAVGGDLIAVGARRDDGAGQDAGRVYVLRGAVVQELSAEDPGERDELGTSLSLDGGVLAVGAPFAGHGGAAAGAAYVFELQDDGSWSRFRLPASPRAGDAFGYTVAVRGGVVVVGAPLQDGGGQDAGAAYRYRRGQAWELAGPLSASPAAGDQFGVSVAFDGATLVVGARRDDRQGRDAGAAFLFGAAGDRQAVLVADPARPGAELGFTAAVRGCTVVVGAFQEDGGRGAVHTFASPGTCAGFAGEATRVPESAGAVRIPLIVQAGGGPSSQATVRVIAETAREGSDYTRAAPSFEVVPGTSVEAARLADDARDEPDETFRAVLTLPASLGWIGSRQNQVTIVDDDEPPRLVRTQEVCVSGDGTVLFAVTLANQGTRALGGLPGHEFEAELPWDSLSLVSATADRGAAAVDFVRNRATWNGTIPPGGAVTVTLLAALQPGAAAGTPVESLETLRFDRDGDGSPEAAVRPETIFVVGTFPCSPGLGD